MKYLTIIFLVILSYSTQAQQTDYNLKRGYVAEGYDVTEYFNNKALKGDAKFTTTYDNVKFKFVSQANLDKFNKDPKRYVPEYGGYCAYALAIKGEKIDINPETFEIRDGKLYLFYNSWGTNTLEKWIEEGPEKLKEQADAAWAKINNRH